MDPALSPTHLLNEIDALKRRLRDQEDLFNSQDEEWQQEVAALKKEKKSLTEEVKALRSELMETKDELTLLMQKANGTPKKEIIKVIQPAPLSPSPVNKSFLNEFEAIQDQCEALQADKATLEMHIAEVTKEIEKIAGINAELESTCAEKEMIIEEQNEDTKRLNRQVAELREEIALLNARIHDLSQANVDPKTRGNSMFGEVDEARKKAEEELRLVVERNVFLEKELEEANNRSRRLTHASLTHADQGEIDFQKNFGEMMFAELQSHIRMKEQYRKEVDELQKKFAEFKGNGDAGQTFAITSLQQQLEIRNKELAKVQKVCDDQTKKIYQLGAQVKEISALRNEIKALENKKTVLEEELKILKGPASVPLSPKVLASIENELPKKQVSTPLSTLPPRPNPSKTQPDAVTKPVGGSKWADKLTKRYKETARQSANREQSLDIFSRRAVSMKRDGDLKNPEK